MSNTQDQSIKVGSAFLVATGTICFFMWFYDLYSKTHYVVYNVNVWTTIFYALWAIKLLLSTSILTRPKTLTAIGTNKKWAIIHTKCSFEEHDSRVLLLARVAVGGKWCSDRTRQSRGGGFRLKERERGYMWLSASMILVSFFNTDTLRQIRHTHKHTAQTCCDSSQ